MAATGLSRKTLDDLKRRHVAFLEQRLTSAEARADWIAACRDGYDRLLAVRIREVLDPEALEKGIHDAFTADSVRTFFAPLLRELQREALGTLKADTTKIGDYVPADARSAIDALLARRGLVPDALVRKVFEQQVVVDALHDTLHEGLTQFNTTVNPFFAEWGLPSVLKRMPFGGGLILASMDAMRAEFDRRLEPEIRRFLAPFSRKATAQLAEMFVAKSGDPRFLELRKNLASFLYSQSLAELLAGVDDEAAEDIGTAAGHIAVKVLARDRRDGMLRGALEDYVETHGDETLGGWLEELGATGQPFVEEWAGLLWPVVEQAMRSPVVRDVLARITAEFYDGLGN